MSETIRRYKFLISDTATSELRDLKRRDSDSFDALIVLLMEIRSDMRTCEQLIDVHYADSTIRVVEEFRSAQSEGINAYTAKLYELSAWRLITAGDHRTRTVAIMSVMHRSRDYEADKKLMDNLRRDYEALGFNRIP